MRPTAIHPDVQELYDALIRSVYVDLRADEETERQSSEGGSGRFCRRGAEEGGMLALIRASVVSEVSTKKHARVHTV